MRKLLLSICLVATAIFAIGSSAFAGTNPVSEVCAQAPTSAICKQAKAVDGSTTNPIATTLHTAANIIALVTGVIAVIMIIISGLTLVTSRGDSNAVTTSRNRIIYASVGLIIISMAWSITTLLVDHLA